jgi:hypothetical protein
LRIWESRYEGEERGRAGRKKILLAWISLAVVFIAGASVSILKRVNTPDARSPKATIHSDIPTSKEYYATMPQLSRAELALTKKIRLLKPITSTLDKANGTRVFHCPDIHIGYLTWWLDKKPNVDSASYSSTHGQKEAYGDVSVPADKPVWLVVSWNRHKDAFQCPDILAKFGPGELTGLELTAPAPVADFGEEDQVKLMSGPDHCNGQGYCGLDQLSVL